jgi:DNA-directed RNA polymerase specialized sigma24 family protein
MQRNPVFSSSAEDDDHFLRQFEPHIRIVAGTMRRTYRAMTADDEKDLQQELRLKLLEVPADRRNAGAFVRTVLNNAARDFLAKVLRHADRHISGDSTTDGDFSSSLFARFGTDDDTEETQLVDSLWTSLSPTQKQLMDWYLGLSGAKPIKRMRTLSDMSGLSAGTVRREIDSALAKMRRMVSTKKYPVIVTQSSRTKK